MRVLLAGFLQVALGLGGVAKLMRYVPRAVSIGFVNALTVGFGLGAIPTVGDKGELPHSLPVPGLPDVPLSLHTLSIIALPAVAMAIVGLLETQMTARLGRRNHRDRLPQGPARPGVRASPTSSPPASAAWAAAR